MGDDRRSLLGEYRPDLALTDICAELAPGMASRSVKRCFGGFASATGSNSKNRRDSEQERFDVAEVRHRYSIRQQALDPECLVFLDEMAATMKLTHTQPLPTESAPYRPGDPRSLEDLEPGRRTLVWRWLYCSARCRFRPSSSLASVYSAPFDFTYYHYGLSV
jgi:hypothetical protein